ncbi:hydroxymethylglutaryl-CoA lyase [Spongiactinospora gelatinilytica]|uniref:Hydroxymethylglutaryl-CoA lyase n=1 Tax=Spongiactinospora gelatinilytica TaxID=2666298 RepID=A0A2W2G5E6_9ACTN|nr:hydroxymethylglutaryl-CoA lyase [Spongiactinospora gelatinilytica]PZG45106.1 hydroxymethylglutaryl-CoA lyase [Spongiactinospora gelatinilytica]
MHGDRVTICECFARDGLQHEEAFVPTDVKIELIDAFREAGFTRIEATSYSHPERVPAFRDASAVLAGLTHADGVAYKATCPNPRAVQRALADLDAGHGATELSLLVSATESHTERNLGTTRERQWDKVAEMARLATGRFRLVGVISVAFGCPFEGAVDPAVVAEDVARFAELGVDLVTLGDTTGLATPKTVSAAFRRTLAAHPGLPVVAHFHNTRGTGIANCVAALEAGCRDFDTAIGGVGGHPAQIQYGGGITGNVCTEDLVNLLESEGVSTGLDLGLLMAASRRCEQALGRTLHSMVARAGFGLTHGEVPQDA